eukprot:3990483-Amphidinium_carterae.2
MFVRLAEETRSGIKPSADGRPLDAAMLKLMDNPSITFHFLPVPMTHASSAFSASSVQPSHPDGLPFAAGYSKPKGKGKRAPTAPPPGTIARMPDGKNLCFAYNSASSCNIAKPGKKCMRGYHLCGRPGCHGKHSATACTKPAAPATGSQ